MTFTEKINAQLAPVKQKLREEIIPNFRRWFKREIRGCHQGWLWAGIGLWLGADVVQNTFAMVFGVVPYVGQWLIDTTLDPIMTFVLGPLPMACGLELLHRWGWINPPDHDALVDNKNDAR